MILQKAIRRTIIVIMGIKERLIEIEELASRKFTVTLTADGSQKDFELRIDNCRCVKNCDDNFVVLSVYGMDIHISGTPLVLENFGAGSVCVTGKIHSLTFEEN